jgi:5,10-methylene-tetrahydrofolate dehydrogenase/methenyl tetrahydrofolate cyclohydrolase
MSGIAHSSHVLSGVVIAQKQLGILSKAAAELHKKGQALTLGAVQVGESKDTLLYARSLENLLKKLGIGFVHKVFPKDILEQDLCRQILKLNADPELTGIMVFAPLPASINPVMILNAIDLLKDVEGRRVLHGMGDRVLSPTASAVLALLEETQVEIAGKEAVVVGHSDVVGKPIAILLLDKMATVTVCHAKTRHLREHVERAEIVVAAAGKPHLIKGEWIKPGAIVIDVGENVVDGKLVGDVEFEAAKARASFISPVPGGVGPVTNVMLVKNLLTLQKMRDAINGNH